MVSRNKERQLTPAGCDSKYDTAISKTTTATTTATTTTTTSVIQIDSIVCSKTTTTTTTSFTSCNGHGMLSEDSANGFTINKDSNSNSNNLCCIPECTGCEQNGNNNNMSYFKLIPVFGGGCDAMI
jgi:hypothetical protein